MREFHKKVFIFIIEVIINQKAEHGINLIISNTILLPLISSTGAM